MAIAFEEEKQIKELERLRRVDEERRAKSLAQKQNLPYLDLTMIPINIEALATIPEEKAKKAGGAILQKIANKLQMAVLDSTNPETTALIEELKSQNFSVSFFIVSHHSMAKAITAYKLVPAAKEEITGRVKVAKTITDFGELKTKIAALGPGHTAEIIELSLSGGLGLDASDIHVEPEEKEVRLRYRIDGELQDIAFFGFPIYRSLLSRIKLLSGLQINVHDIPQDGRFTILWVDQQVEIRVSIIPSAYGEAIVMRILNPKAISVTIDKLGFREDEYKIIQEELGRPNGIILNTGPTGSGKTTTLYAFLRHLNEPGVKIITVEDPIEYHVAGISQSQIEAGKGYTFGAGLRSILRQDPDIILVGEMRDLETAETSIHAALTGHLVFSTLHTNDATGTVPRLVDMGINPNSIGPSLNLAIAQRLVRKVCQNCSVKQKITVDTLEKFKKVLATLPAAVKPPNLDENSEIAAPKGCEKCNNSGYKGRMAIFEIFRMTPEMKKFVMANATNESAIREFAIKQGMTTMGQDGAIKILQGLTTLEEVEGTVGKLE